MSNSDADIQDLEAAKSRALIENTAQAIYKHLQDLEDKKSLVMSRWVWELLQNARDAAPRGSDIKVFLSVQRGKLIFRHSGAPFTNEEISHLIYHGSTKHQGIDADPIGHFGSGFISTHLISKRIQVSGSMITGPRFSFALDREAESPAALSRVMDQSWEEFKDSLHSDAPSIDGGFTTEYVYDLTPDTAQAVDAGVVALRMCAPYVLAFNPKLVSVEVQTEKETIQVSKSSTRDTATRVRVVEVESRLSTGQNDRCHVALTAEGDVSIAALLVTNDGGFAIEVLPQVPKIFVAFPLYGTDDFAFPVVVNSQVFKPTEDRDGVFLGRSDSESNKANMAMMQVACRLLLRLISVATNQQWGRTHSLAYVGRVVQKPWLDDKWYEGLVKEELIDKVRSTSFLTNAAEVNIPPRDSWIPSATAGVSMEALWDVTHNLHGAADRLPRRDDSGAWERVLFDWASHFSSRPEEFAECWTLRKLAELVAGLGTVSALGANLSEGTDPISWLNHIHGLLMDAGLKTLFDDQTLLPNQSGMFRRRNALVRDGGIDENLKDIATELGIDVRDSLLHPGISTASVKALLPAERKEEEVLEQALKELQKRAEGRLVGPDLNANVSLLNWIVEHRYYQHIPGFPAITEAYGDGTNETLNLPTGTTDERDDLPLAPVQQWPTNARLFADLFPRRFVLNSEHYGEVVPEYVWQTLAARGHVRLCPVYESESITQDFLPEDVSDSAEGVTHRSMTTVEQSSIAFLKKNDIGLIDTARKSRTKSVQLLKFILGPTLEVDSRWSETPNSSCECGQEHRYFRAGWLPTLKELRWVYLARNRSTNATAESIAGLAESDEELRRFLSDERATELIRALGISPAEMSLRSFAKDEETRVTLIRSLSVISEATGGDTNRVVALANAVKDDPTLIELVEERAKARDRVRRNQAVGRSVEQILAAALGAKGLSVSRTGVGSDYEVESDFVEGSQEVLLSVGGGRKSYLIEIKATTGMNAKMTTKQAETASSHKDNFVLCMVRLTGSDVTEGDVAVGARFIFDIGERIQPLWETYKELQKWPHS